MEQAALGQPMKLATAYYPDYHPEEEWERDYRLIREAGIERIRIAEFAWAKMEPEDGVFEWGWLDRSLAKAAACGLDVILCTPTACPPIWLVEKDPGILPVGRNGRIVGFGARQHRSYSSETYLSHSLRLVEKMAEHYGNHPAVVAWQIDNEFGGETKYDYSEASRRGFHRYLERKFGSVDNLNERWGTAFWSQTYAKFDQVPLPAPYDSDVMMWPHPSLELEFERFSSWTMTEFHDRQQELIRRYSSAQITTNAFMFNWGDNVRWPDLFRHSDVVGIDIYSREPAEIAFYADACRSLLGRPFWVMEYDTGSPSLTEELNLASARGCDWFSLFKFRVFPWGQEQEAAKGGLLTVTGDPRPNYDALRLWTEDRDSQPFIEAGKSSRSRRSEAEKSPTMRVEMDSEPSVTAVSADAGLDVGTDEAKTETKVSLEAATSAAAIGESGFGVYYDFDCSWSYRLSKNDPQAYFEYVFRRAYSAVYTPQETVKIVFEPSALVGIGVLLLPLQIMYDKELEEALIRFVEQGGHLIATADLFRKNRDNVFLTQVPELFGKLLSWTDNRFAGDVPELEASEEILLAEGEFGQGRTWLIRRDADAGAWKQLAAKARKLQDGK